MSVLLVVNTAPCGSEGPYHAFRLADARVATIHDLAEATLRCERVLSILRRSWWRASPPRA